MCQCCSVRHKTSETKAAQNSLLPPTSHGSQASIQVLTFSLVFNEIDFGITYNIKVVGSLMSLLFRFMLSAIKLVGKSHDISNFL